MNGVASLNAATEKKQRKGGKEERKAKKCHRERWWERWK